MFNRGITQLQMGGVVNVSSLVSASKESEGQMKFTFPLNFRSQHQIERNVNKTKVLFSELFRNKYLDSGRRGVVGISY